MKLDAKKIRKLLNILKENKKNVEKSNLEALSDGFVVTTSQGLKYTVEDKDDEGITVSYADLAGNFKIEKLSFDKFKSLFQKSGKKKSKSKGKDKVVTDD